MPCISPGALPFETYVDLKELRRYYNDIVPFSSFLEFNASTGVLNRVDTVNCVHHKCGYRDAFPDSPGTGSTGDALGLLDRRLMNRRIYGVVRKGCFWWACMNCTTVQLVSACLPIP